MFQDFLLSKTESEIGDYLKFVAVNIGLGGLFTRRTPCEIIEGYSDPVLTEIETDTNLYEGGDLGFSPFISLM